jgi:hypothetical protein
MGLSLFSLSFNLRKEDWQYKQSIIKHFIRLSITKTALLLVDCAAVLTIACLETFIRIAIRRKIAILSHILFSLSQSIRLKDFKTKKYRL